MVEDTFTEVTSESWLSRIGGAFKGIVIGFVLFIAAFPLLFWNEGRALKRYKTLNEGAGSFISLPRASVFPENEGRLVHVTGKAVTAETLVDPEFGVALNAVKLIRKVEMLQWEEHRKRQSKKKLGGGKKTVTTYSYSKTWSSSLINSNNFKKPHGHQNPAGMPYQSKSLEATRVSLGEFNLSRSLVGQINNATPLPLGDLVDIDRFPGAEYHDGGLYFGEEPASPQIGDLRITFRVVAPTDVSVVSRQTKETFSPYRAEAGGTINMLSIGIVAAEDMFEMAHQSNVMWTWIIRIGGFVLMLIGVAMILKPLSVIADVVPVVGNVVGAGTGILSILIAAPFAFLTVAIAWLRYRPVIGMVLLVLASVAAGLIFILSKRGKSAQASSPADFKSARKRNRRSRVAEKISQTALAGAKRTQPASSPAAGTAGIAQTAAAAAGRENAAGMLINGLNFFRSGQYDKAIMQFSRAIKSGGDRKVAHYNRGVALFKLNKKDAALEDIKHAAELGHEKAKAVLNKINPN